MITSRQRSYLRGLANKIEATMSIGKEGITENVIKQADILLNSRELIKVTVQRNSEFTAKELVATLSQKLEAEPVQAIGSTFVLYKKSNRSDIIHIEI